MKIAPMIGVAAALALLAGCADGGGYYGEPGVDVVGYDGYYDDAYGPFYDGYWGSDGGFYYRRNAHEHFQRDSANHFRRDNTSGFHAVHGHPHGGGGNHGGDHKPG